MKVYFLQNIPHVAKAGEVKEVSDGYYRNFLVPKKLAIPATDTVVKQAAVHSQAVVRHTHQAEGRLTKLAGQLDGFRVVVHAQASPEGTLFGSVTATVIVEALKKAGYTIEERWVKLEHGIKKLGKFPVELQMPQGKKAMITIDIVRAT